MGSCGAAIMEVQAQIISRGGQELISFGIVVKKRPKDSRTLLSVNHAARRLAGAPAGGRRAGARWRELILVRDLRANRRLLLWPRTDLYLRDVVFEWPAFDEA
jgi:hypothetical protein